MDEQDGLGVSPAALQAAGAACVAAAGAAPADGPAEGVRGLAILPAGRAAPAAAALADRWEVAVGRWCDDLAAHGAALDLAAAAYLAGDDDAAGVLGGGAR
ncbi:hypothetical protein [Actinomycetospora straminea]|uniref:hypothetical protein n=1 Tax=Actinomycetospora straminea TaxID=663607 RepID=UPI002365541A|nr:hypothetical protein [Actinomycetospora straminea]MDD7932694.1 hypothetical protein [Actinomycetospora straminea]